ncbi:MBL fold metallo-hydrolase [Bittarella massiliensis]|uniref:MBL fold metallo-hydrolase n=1 Tax=Bittarella massiliensis (ex Durand et al. 2017) TaxID=1720313 RepID=UPI00163BE55A|nr:MBL fold metallo-hydrolase [Bittarella massiliensis (ex Durand et al. 2017)]MBC2872340.1 MBL fold metallo-hydrolase [Bittarella massiliensis (ex Durand et al. 2017)]
MLLTVLSENRSDSPFLGAEHGLSIYLEAGGRRLLFDMGASGLFWKNARKLGIDLLSVEMAFLSHGHDDHSGGLPTFLKGNARAPVYLREGCFAPLFSRSGDGCRPIGPDPALAASPRLVFTSAQERPAEGLLLFSDLCRREHWPSTNRNLLLEEGGVLGPDPFLHEQYLLVQEGGTALLLSGCAHRGIENIVARCAQHLGRAPDAVVSGFHLTSPRSGQAADAAEVQAVGRALAAYPHTRYYTCHCTGEGPFAQLRGELGDRLFPLHAGQRLAL